MGVLCMMTLNINMLILLALCLLFYSSYSGDRNHIYYVNSSSDWSVTQHGPFNNLFFLLNDSINFTFHLVTSVKYQLTKLVELK